MKVLLIRHGIAEDSGRYGGDFERPLTPEGRKKMARSVEKLRKIIPSLDRIVPSPLVRAVETAQILHEGYPGAAFEELPGMAAGAQKGPVFEYLERCKDNQTIALIGHQPDLSGLLAEFVTDRGRPFADFDKGGCALVEFYGRPGKGQGVLVWLMDSMCLTN